MTATFPDFDPAIHTGPIPWRLRLRLLFVRPIQSTDGMVVKFYRGVWYILRDSAPY